MVRAVAETTDETAEWIGKTELSPGVMEAMGRVPRHLFVPPDLQDMGVLEQAAPHPATGRPSRSPTSSR